MKRKIVIVGGVGGGATAAARLRRLSAEDEIIIFEKDQYISFSNCGMPYYLGGVVENRRQLIINTPDEMAEKYNLEVRNFSAVTAIDREAQMVTVRKTQSGETYQERYDILILSPGASPLVPPIPGLDEARDVYTLRNISDMDEIAAALENQNPRNAVVIGGGFIGVEVAENLARRGIHVTIAEMADQVLKPLDPEMAEYIHTELRDNGVDLALGDGIEKFDQGDVVLKSGKRLPSDLTILAMGIRPNSDLAKEAGLEIGPKGHIVTTKTYETLDAETGKAVANIFAIGDAVEVWDLVDDSKTAIALAGPANRQARTLADHIHGRPFKIVGASGSSVAKVFSLTFAATGNNAGQLKAKGLSFKEMHIDKPNRTPFYPGATTVHYKLLYDPDSRQILGAQAVGGDGAEKRIDVLATVMTLGGTVDDLSSLQLCYSPPYASARDAIVIMGYNAEGDDD